MSLQVILLPIFVSLLLLSYSYFLLALVHRPIMDTRPGL